MRELLPLLMSALQQGRPVAWCRLVETRGSTPQKAGAAMLAFGDGSQAGTLGGGCVEAEVKRRAHSVLAEQAAAVLCFQLDDDYGWDDGLICGGRMQVLVDPLASSEDRRYCQTLARLAEDGQGWTEAIIFDAQASGLPAGASYLFDGDGQLLAHTRGPLADGAAPPNVLSGVSPLVDRPRPHAAGGASFLPVLSSVRLLIVGGGHVGQAVARLAAELEFEVWVVDDREEYVSAERFPAAQRRIAGSVGNVLPTLPINSSTYCLIVTRGHNHDEEALYHLVERGAGYVGMIGSKRKIRMIFDDLLAEGVSQESLDRVRAPVGLDIGSQTVAEIAVSIAAELVAHRNLGLGAESHASSLSSR